MHAETARDFLEIHLRSGITRTL
nr:hypothetical protein [Escherichia coli]